MSSSSSDWGGSGDFSFLLQSIEGKIGAVLPESPIQTIDSAPSTVSKKRSRLSIDAHDFSFDEDNTITNTLKASSNLKSLVEFDELRLENERLREKLIQTEAENQAGKERILRQLVYLEEQYTLTKKDLQTKSEKYFEDKKKWQMKVRELEVQIQKQSTSSLPSKTPSSASFVAPVTAGHEEVTRKLAQLENAVVFKSKELQAAQTQIAKLETDLLAARQELLSSTPANALKSQDPQESDEMKDMRLRCQDLELSLKRKSREMEKLDSKLRNQKLLEEEVAAATSKLSLSQETIKKFEAMEAKYLKLVDERNQWKQLFQGVLKTQQQQSGASSVPADSDVNPVSVLRLLSSSQEKCSLLLKTQSDLEQQNTSLNSKLLRLEAKSQESERTVLDLNHRLAALTSQNSLVTQHVGLFEGEIQSMRTLLKTYDMEFSLGKTSLDSVVSLKNQTIEALTQQLDKCRGEAGGLVQRLQALEGRGAAGGAASGGCTADGTAVPAAAGTSVSESELASLKLETDILRMELSALKEVTGMDFIPGRTKVLHLADNPSAAAAAKRRQSAGSMDTSSASEEDHSSIPMEELRRLRRENKQLTAALASGSGGVSGGESGSAASVTATTTTTAAAAAPASVKQSDPLNQSVLGSSAAGSICPSCVAGIADSNKHNQRLKEMFKERISSFREAVYLLTGYKIELHNAESSSSGSSGGKQSLPKLRCRSMFAEKPDDCLIFQWKGDTLELLDTEFASKLDSKLFTVLTTCNSVPAFMASVTLDLFEHQTFMGQTL